METTYYTLTAREILAEGQMMEKASGDGARRLVCVRRAVRQEERSPEGKVIDLAAWRAEREESCAGELWEDGAYDTPEAESAAVRRERRDRRPVLAGGELLATLSVVGVMAMLLVRILGTL